MHHRLPHKIAMGWMDCACQQKKTSFLSLFPPKCAEKHISSQQILNRNPIYPLEKGISGKFTLIFDARAISRRE
jgi:hypothetical protein